MGWNLGAERVAAVHKSVLLVCMGNICRSPMAMTVARRFANVANGEASQGGRASAAWHFDSAGTHAGHIGGRPDVRANSVLLRHGYDECRHRARRISARDFERFDLILAMDRDNLSELRRQCPADLLPKLGLFLDHAPDLRGQEVPDPYYGSIEGFERVLRLCEAGAAGLVEALRARAQ
jgi:protein-tyrosine phosphatase